MYYRFSLVTPHLGAKSFWPKRQTPVIYHNQVSLFPVLAIFYTESHSCALLYPSTGTKAQVARLLEEQFAMQFVSRGKYNMSSFLCPSPIPSKIPISSRIRWKCSSFKDYWNWIPVLKELGEVFRAGLQTYRNIKLGFLASVIGIRTWYALVELLNLNYLWIHTRGLGNLPKCRLHAPSCEGSLDREPGGLAGHLL